jgi:hypothetical protein
MLGYGFMGKADSNALRTLTYIDWPGVLRPELTAIAGRTEDRVADASCRYGFEGYYTDWRELGVITAWIAAGPLPLAHGISKYAATTSDLSDLGK